MLKILGVLVAILLGTILLIVLIGYSLPKDHTAARAISLHRQPAEVFALISDFKNQPSWRPDVQEVEMRPERDGHTRFAEKSKDGRIIFEVEESTPPQRMVTRIIGKNLPFGGRWIFEISPAADGCRLNITERGEVYNPVFRFVSRFILGYTGTLDRYLTSVARKFGESTVPVEGKVSERSGSAG
jgi:hypothetical protein